jgi:predicted RNA binding protein YcfA (HicA-like mRNA interferase family)
VPKLPVVPLHPDPSPGTLLAILKQSGLSRDELLKLL